MMDPLERAMAAFRDSSFVAFASANGGRKESRSSTSHEWLFTCPHCASSRLRFNAKKGIGLCWGCRRGFSTFTLVRDLQRLDDAATVTWFTSRYVGGDSEAQCLTSSLAPLTPPKLAVRSLPAISWPAGVELLSEPCAPHARAWEYLARRGIDVQMVRQFRLAFGRTGRLQDRIVFPCWMDGVLVYWQARATWDPPPDLAPEQVREWRQRTGYVKSLNPISKGDEAQAHEVIYNYDRARCEPHVVICEGPIDAIKVGAHAVALLGKVASPVKIERLKRMRAQRYTIYLDRGDEETASAEALARELSAWADVRICQPPPGYDAGALDRATNAAVVSRAVPWSQRAHTL